ncbi:uncharacterized protein LOC131214699 [Anopheles bellator]|uniref:uncharacterized protein LOC131214698 n=1 Tax=Anopheles bellator TaxID=139047 RepID=UPI0026482C4C|nr:uncharacterized protein LOC131214698 [Anopheles bellator]XP_058065016.1 uncharacterized protein LOC131214699 [Anopheles bellator]
MYRLGQASGEQSVPSDCCCWRAYESFMCYLHYYGNVVYGPQFRPEDHSRQVQIAYECIKVLQTPEEVLRRLAAGRIPDEPAARCLLRCFFLRTGLYDAERGFNLRRLYTWNYENPDRRYLSPEVHAKLHAIRLSRCDQCTEVYRSYREVIGGLGSPFQDELVLRDAAKLALSSGSRCEVVRIDEPPQELDGSYDDPHEVYEWHGSNDCIEVPPTTPPPTAATEKSTTLEPTTRASTHETTTGPYFKLQPKQFKRCRQCRKPCSSSLKGSFCCKRCTKCSRNRYNKYNF